MKKGEKEERKKKMQYLFVRRVPWGNQALLSSAI